jgi:phage baseplate assembly protein W
MGNINFISAGTTASKIEEEKLDVTSTPFGIKTPLRQGTIELFEVTYSLKQQVKDNLKNLLLTNWGERLGLYNLGANLSPELFNFVSLDDFDAVVVQKINDAVKKWMPYVTLNNYVSKVDYAFQSSTNKNKVAVIKVLVMYSVPALDVSDDNIELTLYVP